MSVIRVFADDKQPRLTEGLKLRRYKNREFEAFTISWLPSDFMTNPDLCVFKGTGARLFAKANDCPLSPGRNFTLEETIKLAANAKNAVAMWGPYEIDKKAFDLVVERKRLLDSGAIKQCADDRLYRKDRVAINCFHAMAGLNELSPMADSSGRVLRWGLNGTARVLIEYIEKAKSKHVLLEPVDVKKDRYGFVYAPTRNRHGLYNPVRNASAYRRYPSVLKADQVHPYHARRSPQVSAGYSELRFHSTPRRYLIDKPLKLSSRCVGGIKPEKHEHGASAELTEVLMGLSKRDS